MDELINNLNAQFRTRYSKMFAELNKNVYVSAKTDAGYEAPVIQLGVGGGTEIKDGAAELNPPAKVSLKFKQLKATGLIYRIAIPMNECEVASKNPAYFNFLLDTVVSSALGNYKKTVGDEKIVRFGENYCEADNEGTVFRYLSDDELEIRLQGSWASKEIANG